MRPKVVLRLTHTQINKPDPAFITIPDGIVKLGKIYYTILKNGKLDLFDPFSQKNPPWFRIFVSFPFSPPLFSSPSLVP